MVTIDQRASQLEAARKRYEQLKRKGTKGPKPELKLENVEQKNHKGSKLTEDQTGLLEEQKATIEKQKATIEGHESTIESQNAIINEQKTTIEKQESTIESQNATINEQKSTIENQKVTISNLRDQTTDLKLAKMDLDDRLAELEAASKPSPVHRIQVMAPQVENPYSDQQPIPSNGNFRDSIMHWKNWQIDMTDWYTSQKVAF